MFWRYVDKDCEKSADGDKMSDMKNNESWTDDRLEDLSPNELTTKRDKLNLLLEVRTLETKLSGPPPGYVRVEPTDASKLTYEQLENKNKLLRQELNDQRTMLSIAIMLTVIAFGLALFLLNGGGGGGGG